MIISDCSYTLTFMSVKLFDYDQMYFFSEKKTTFIWYAETKSYEREMYALIYI